jgi:hypothetical protein
VCLGAEHHKLTKIPAKSFLGTERSPELHRTRIIVPE